MGLISTALKSVSSTVSDQYKEYFYCEALASDVLVTKGVKKGKNGSDNIITDGSVIAVADGQCMMIIEQGKIVEVCAEPGEFIYNNSTEPSIFNGPLMEGIKNTFAEIGKRFTMGGVADNDQRIYYFNTKEIMNNKYGTPNPVPFRVVDKNVGLDVDISIRCHGEYSYKIINPLLFYTNVCGNVSSEYNREEIDEQLKSELMTALQPAFAKISEMGIRYSALPGHTIELSDALNEVLSKKWSETRGIAVASFGISSVSASPEDEQMIKDLQRNAAYRDPSMAGAALVGAQADAMKDAAKNPNGAFMGFANMNSAAQTGGANAQQFFAMSADKKENTADGWTCSCGTVNTGNFCTKCGAAKPEATSAFCPHCGGKLTDPNAKFCPSCGKPLQ